MPRRPRMYIAGLPFHVIQRGNNRQPCFYEHADRYQYLAILGEAMAHREVQLHAFVLMTNHVHLLMTAQHADGISSMMRDAGSAYVHYVNARHGRTGTLWEGRHRASPVQEETYFLRCHRYIELNPVRAGIVAAPGDYPWSSFRANALGEEVGLLRAHRVYESLGATPAERRSAYQRMFQDPDLENSDESIRSSARACVPLGSADFCEDVARRVGQTPARTRRGRPPRDRAA